MKLLYAAALFFALMPNAQAQKVNKKNHIDSIENADQIKTLITEIDKSYNGFAINEALAYKPEYSDFNCKSVSDSLKIKPYVKADFDKNGLTDLLVIGNRHEHCVLCILDKGNNVYEIKQLTRRSFQKCTFPVVTDNKVKYYFEDYPTSDDTDNIGDLTFITLIYKYGDFVEENPFPAKHKIEKIEYNATFCYGVCPVFKLTIDSNRQAIWDAEEYNVIRKQEFKGRYNTIVSNKEYEEILDLLNYMDFEKLMDNYAVNWTDDQSAILKITYDGGKVKTIDDYGLLGTFGLDRLHQLMFALRESQKWRK